MSQSAGGGRSRIVAVLATLTLVLSACGGAATTAPTAPPVSPTPTAAASAPASASPAASAPASVAPSASAQAGTCPDMPTSPVTLTYWDFGGYLSDQGVAQLDTEFMAKYPNVKLVRVLKSLNDIQASEKLAASADNPPDMVVTNAGLGLAAPLVVAKLIIPLTKYESEFGWDTRFPGAILDQFRLASDGAHWGSGNTLYSIGIGASFVGLFYNKALLDQLGVQVPTTWDQFISTLDKAKAAGLIPIAEGSQNPTWTVIHMYTSWQNVVTPTQQLNDFQFHVPGATFDTPENLQAAKLSLQLVQKGYFSPNFLGIANQAAIDSFTAGKALYYLEGTYFAGPIYKAMGENLGIIAVPPMDGGPFSVTGGAGLGWAITAKSPIPDVAGCYIDWRTGPHASDLYVAEGGLPSMNYNYTGTSAFSKSLFDAWLNASAKKALVPYLDDATPTFLTVLTTQIEQMLGGKITPEQYTKVVQQYYAQYRP